MLPKRRRPTHPGRILWSEFLEPLSLSSAQFADKLGEGWNPSKVQNLIDGKEAFSETWAPQFAELLGTTSEFWTHLQRMYKEWETIQKRDQQGSLKRLKKAS